MLISLLALLVFCFHSGIAFPSHDHVVLPTAGWKQTTDDCVRADIKGVSRAFEVSCFISLTSAVDESEQSVFQSQFKWTLFTKLRGQNTLNCFWAGWSLPATTKRSVSTGGCQTASCWQKWAISRKVFKSCWVCVHNTPPDTSSWYCIKIKTY